MSVPKPGPGKGFVNTVFDGYYGMQVKDWAAPTGVWPRCV